MVTQLEYVEWYFVQDVRSTIVRRTHILGSLMATSSGILATYYPNERLQRNSDLQRTMWMQAGLLSNCVHTDKITFSDRLRYVAGSRLIGKVK
jgi:hypothetical protein